MKYKAVFSHLGRILIVSAAFYIFPVLVCLFCKEFSFIPSFLIGGGVSLALGAGMVSCSKKKEKIRTKEGLVIVGLSWVFLSAIGALPLFISGAIPHYIDALFEMVSGFTTTGATVLTEFDTVGKSMHFWRAFSHWLGGMGILVFMLAVLPSQDAGDFQLMKFESPGPQVGKLVSKVRFTATILYLIYFAFTVLEFLFLWLGGVDVYHAIVLSVSTAGTGGFAATAGSIADFNSAYVEIVVTVFMFIFSVNFNLYYLLLLKKFLHVVKDEEFRFYLGYLLIAITAITLDNTFRNAAYDDSFWTALRHSAFSVVTISSTTGFITADFATWSLFSQSILLLTMFIGAMAGSTGGGFKMSRALILIKSGREDTKKILRSHGVFTAKMNKKPLASEIVTAVRNYFFLSAAIIALSTILVSLDSGVDFTTAFTGVLTCFGNVGPGLGSIIGPTGNFSSLSCFTKLVLSLDMLLGRLEIFPILLLFNPKTWSKRY